MVLIIPACERGRGGGHLSRSLLLLKNLQFKGFDTYLWIPEALKEDFIQRFKDFFKTVNRLQILSRREELEGRDWKLIILDRFRISRKEFALWSSLKRHSGAVLVGIDEGGPCRKNFDFLIDLLPGISRHRPNFTAPALLHLPKNRRSIEGAVGDAAGHAGPERPLRVLISFGVEDSAGLGIIAARSIVKNYSLLIPNFSLPEITLIAPIPPEKPIAGVEIKRKIPHLMEHLAEYDLFITHFGLGAFEAVYARLPVMLLHPTRYHKRLAKNAGFITLSFASLRLCVSSLCENSSEIAKRYGLEDDQKEDISSFIAGLKLHAPAVCPACGGEARRSVLARFPEETYRCCHRCGIIFLARLKPPPFEYGREYFFEQYKKQYGKTYLEDFPNLLEMARRRLGHIQNISQRHKGHSKRSLLDIGCAYGPFMAAAAEAGFAPMGLEPCEDAARYVTEELGFPCRQGFFPQALKGAEPGLEGPFDLITLWYVVEHFKEPGQMLREIHGLLKEGGLLAFSTPSFSGISGRKSLKNFLEASPADHWTIWSPRICKRVLKRHGFRLRKIVITGHHPERFPLFGRFVESRFVKAHSAGSGKEGLLYRLLLLLSRLLRLGDGFEAYAVKVNTKKYR
ncbi:MAG: methyltransferase domain-containing protein [Treponema sp.]|nr:methyltransferase domain-containing protein [Treponema sp.]